MDERARLDIGNNRYTLTERGRAQAKITGAWLRERVPRPDRIIRSYFDRVEETAQICYPDLPMRQESLLAEADRGIWADATDEEIDQHYPLERRRRDRQGFFHYRPLGGESWPDVERRVRAFRRSVRENYPNKTLVVFGHGNWHLVWRKVQNDWDDAEVIRRHQAQDVVENASVSIYHGRFDETTGRPILFHDPATDYIIPWQGHL